MKYILSLGLGVALLAAAIIPFSDASRKAYQEYLYKKVQQDASYRRSTDYRGELDRHLQQDEQRQTLRRTTTSHQLIPNLLFPQEGKRYLYTPNREERTTDVFRPMREGIGMYQDRTGTRAMLPKRDIDDFGILYDFETYENDFFSIRIPNRWVPRHEEGTFLLGSDRQVSVRVQRFENICTHGSFLTCAVALSKNENYDNPLEKMTNLSRVYRSSRLADNILGSFEQTAEYTESFVGLLGGQEKFVARHFVQGLDGEVFLVETQSNLHSLDQAVALSKQFFDSFRLYPPEWRTRTHF